MAKQSEKFCEKHTWDDPEAPTHCTICNADYVGSGVSSGSNKGKNKDSSNSSSKVKFMNPVDIVKKSQMKMVRKAGRVSKKSPWLLSKILGDVSLGYPIDVSCTRNGAVYKTFNTWCRQDEDLRLALDAAVLAAESLWVDPMIEAAACGDEESAQWLLRHRLSHKYSTRNEIITHSPDDLIADPTGELIAFITGEEKQDS